MLGGPCERSGFPPPSGGFTPPLCGLFLLRRSHPFDAFRIKRRPEAGHDFFVNVDNAWLVNELSNRKNDPAQVKHWFEWGLALAALGMVRHDGEAKRKQAGDDEDDDGAPDLEQIGRACDGLARVIIPMFRVLYPGPPSAD